MMTEHHFSFLFHSRVNQQKMVVKVKNIILAGREHDYYYILSYQMQICNATISHI